MAAINARELVSQTEPIGHWTSCVLMQGEEPYFLDKLSDFLDERWLDPAAKDFNQTVLYGKETNAEQILSAAKLFPFMSDRRLVLVKEAQQMPDKEWDKLLPYFQNPLDSTLLVMVSRGKNLDRRKKAFKTLEQKGRIVQSDPLKDHQLSGWLDQMIQAKGYRISPLSKALLMDYIGNQLSMMDAEIEKLVLNLKAGEQIELEHIEKYVGISREYNVFELQDALGQEDAAKAYRLALHLGQNPKASQFSLPMCVGTLYAFFQKISLIHESGHLQPQALANLLGIHPYFVQSYHRYAKHYSPGRIRRCIRILLDYDLKAKGLGQGGHLGEADLTQELVMAILYTGSTKAIDRQSTT
ncbi:MAG: DNA polymerase III subunit delta [Sphingomonadales bacterium]|nr:DNA polymerase III subunit delta [Sphingomonadales bacterium]